MFMLRSGPKMEPTLSQFILNFCERSHCFHNMFFEILKRIRLYILQNLHIYQIQTVEKVQKILKSQNIQKLQKI